MDERHWWFASKLQETFHFGGYDNPTLLEDFLSEPDVVELINKFLSPGEPHKLFFYCDATPPSSHCSPVPPSLGGEGQTFSNSSSRRLNLVSGLTRDVLAQGCVCLYVLRRNAETEVDAAMMERELYCGELKNSVLSSLATLLAEAYNPMLHSQHNWRECSDETVSNFLQNFSKFSAALGDSAMKAQMYQPVLQRPGSDLRSYLSHGEQQHRGLGGGGRRWEEAMEESEVLVGDWIGTLESILIDATDERLEDAHGSLQSELNKWKRRHTQICAIVEQLKSKECKTVVAALVASKSRLLKKWRAIDLQITDAFNNVRDRVRYLESLSPHLEPLEALSPPSPSQVVSTTLPALLTTMKQMEGVSKVYACSGYLGVLCVKLSNTLVRLCVSDLETYTSKVEGQFWALASEAINFKAQPPQAKPTKGMKLGSSFISKLESYLQLSASYNEFLSQVRETFLVQHVNFSSVGKKNSLTSAKKPSTSSKSSATDERCASFNNHPLGLSLQNSEKIMAGMNDFTSRVSKILNLACTLGQFTRLNLEQRIKGLPRFSNLWSLECLERSESEREEEADSLSQSLNQSERVSMRTATVRDDGSVSDITLATPDYLDMLISRNIQQQQQQHQLQQLAEPERGGALHSGALSTLKEESWAESQAENEEEFKETEHKPQVVIADEGAASVASTATSVPPSQSQSLHSNSYHSSSSSADSVGVMVHVSIKMIRARLELNCGVGVVEMFGVGGAKSGAIFMQAYQEYADQVEQLERNICIYLKTLFIKPMPSSQALDMLSRFKPIAPRPTIKEALERCMLIAFNRYAMELEQIQVLYEKDKGNPVVSRNVPPVSEAVQWARHLLSRVEQPMLHFRSNETVMKSVYSLHVGKLHNRLATTLLKYETLWLDRWRAAVESGRGSLKAPLLVQEALAEEKIIKVNFSQEMLELLAESKILVRLGVSIPKVARSALSQELRVKEFRQQLEYVLEDYYSTKSSIDPALLPLLTPHIDVVDRSFLPGWTTLTWSTMNIDAFLHRVEGSVGAFKGMVSRVKEILKTNVYDSVSRIREMSLFDVDLATSRMWHPQQFVEVMVASIFERSSKLLHLITIIRTALLEIFSITGSQQQQDAEIHTYLPLPLKPRNPNESSDASSTERRSSTNPELSNKSTPQRSAYTSGIQSTQHTSSLGTMVMTFGQDTLGQLSLSAAAESVLMHFCEVTFDAVNTMVLQSHGQLSVTLWSRSTELSSSLVLKEEGEGGGEKRSNRVVSFNVPDSPEKVESLAEVLRQEGKGGEWQEKIKNLATSLNLSKSFLVDHRILQLVVDIKFSIPRVVLEPSLDEVYSRLMDISSAILDVLRHIKWWAGPNSGKNLHDILEVNGVVETMQSGILQAIHGVSPSIEDCLESLRLYDFLWQQDLHSSYKLFLSSQPQIETCSSQVQNFMELEGKIEAIPAIFSVGPLQLSAKPVKNSLKALAVSWKMEFAAFIHKQAKASLGKLVSECDSMVAHLQTSVESLSQLKDTLQLLHHITDMQSYVDELYLPVEKQYAMLREYNRHLPRTEIEKVDALRDNWEALIELAETVKTQLLSKQRMLFEREVDKQVKAFVVETIQFRNSFDTEGPLVPGLLPNEAVSRLGMFLDLCEELKSKKDLLGSVQKLLNIPPTPYPELDQTEQDISYLRALYKNYQHFLIFDKKFRQVLWHEVDLESAEREIFGFWDAYCRLPAEQQEWDASKKLCSEIEQYKKILPLLTQLHSREIRNRHWLQVMGVVNCTFQLEGSIFKMAHLLDANLLLHVSAIQEIVHCAQLELKLEEKFFSIEEEWSEQNLSFQHYKSHGPVLLETSHTHSLLEQLEHAQMELATMLTSKYIQPLKEEAIQWAAKLATISDILQLWLLVQKLWNNLEAVFNTPETVHEFSGEAVKFASIHKRWMKLMKKAYEAKNVLHCCFGSGDVSQGSLLGEIRTGLEECKKSLNTYLQTKREAFPRFFYVSDDSLLSILSNAKSVSSIQPHLVSLFGAISNVTVTEGGDVPVITGVESVRGECLTLLNPVFLSCGVEQWACKLLESIHSTLRHHITTSPAASSDGDVGGQPFFLEETARTQVVQVSTMALYFQWCKESEHALLQCRYDRRALPGARTKFNNWSVSKLVSLLMKNTWKVADEGMTPLQRLSLESLTVFALWLRDVLDDLCNRKLKDINDFEWQRFLRPYLKSVEGSSSSNNTSDEEEQNSSTVVLQCLDQQIEYGFEYLGCARIPVLTQRSNNYIIAFTQSISKDLGSLVSGPTGSGKVQLIKGIGQICGRNVLSVHCSKLTCRGAVMRTLEGVARDGGWACFSDIQNLSAPSLSILSQMVQLVSTALQSKKGSFVLSSAKELPTYSYLLPLGSAPSMSPYLRTFSFALPDPTQLIRAHCTALGLKAPKALANKLINLQEAANQQLAVNCPQARLSIPCMCHALKVASHMLTDFKGNSSTENQAAKPSPEHQQADGPHRSPMHETKGKRKMSSMHAVANSLSPTAGQPLAANVMREHGFVAQIVLNILGARLPTQELALFTSILKEVFAGSVGIQNIQIQHQLQPDLLRTLVKTPTSSRYFKTAAQQEFSSQILKDECIKAGLSPSQSWMAKVEQLYSFTQLKHAVIVAGKPATGKSAALNTVISTLNAQPGHSTSVKLMRVFPKSVERMSDIFGRVNPSSGDWEDGIFTSIFKKAHQATQSVTWLCMDSCSLDNLWMQYLPELLGESKTLTLSNGEHLLMKEANFKLIFETGSLENASPAALLNSGIVYFDSSVLGWRAVVGTWLSGRNQQEAQCLLKYFEQSMDSIVDFVLHKSGLSAVHSEVGLMETCLAYLSTLLNTYSETAEVFSEIHIERLLLFSVIWSYGGVLVGNKEQLKFSQLLKTLTNSLPDDDSHSSVFDYYVDESGEWDVWQSRIPLDPDLQVDMLGSVFVDTVDSIRVEVLLELALVAKRHALLVGPHGCGKTTICKHFLQSRAFSFTSSEVLKQVTFDGYSRSDMLHHFMEVNFHHRQGGYTYGPKSSKLLQCFIDDLHLPLRHTPNSECSPHEFLRQLTDISGLYSLQRKNEWCIVEDFVIFGALTSSSDALVSDRLRHHFAVIHLPSPGENSLEVVVSQQLQGLLEAYSHNLGEGEYRGVLKSSVELYSAVKETLKVSDLPGRQHYFFSIRNLVSVFQGVCQCLSSGLSNHLSSVWVEEAKRAFTTGICRASDYEWAQLYIHSLGHSKISSDETSTEKAGPFLITALSPEVKQGKEPTGSSSSSLSILPEVNLLTVKNWGELTLSSSHYLRRYREEHGENFDFKISDNNLRCLVRLHRALNFSIGHTIVVGSLGQQLCSLASFALFLAGYEIQTVDFSKESAFRDCMKSLFRQAGLEGKPIGIIIKEEDLEDMGILQALNTVIACGEFPTLFSNDELEGILLALNPSIKRDFPSEDTNPMQYFIARLYRNLRFVICLSPASPLIGSQAHDFKGLLQNTHILWINDWSNEFLMNMTEHFFSNSPATTNIADHMRSSLLSCLSTVHCFTLQETQQLVQVGLQPGHFLQQQQQQQRRQPQLEGSSILPQPSEVDRPSTNDILIEKLLKLNMTLSGIKDVHLPHVGPRTYHLFLECFCETFHRKYSKVISDREHLTKALATLSNTKEQAGELKSALRELRQKHDQASKLSEKLLKSLTLKSCQLEKLKALMGQSSSVLSAMQMVSEQERQLVENEEDDEELLALFMDRHITRLETLVIKAKERLQVAEEEEGEARRVMMKSKEKAIHWHNKIDRNAIDQIKTLNSPPRLVGTIMELMLTLLKQYGVDSQTGSASEGSSASTPGHVAFSKKKMPAFSGSAQTAKIEKEYWNAIQLAIGDSQKFMDLMNGLKWEEGLSTDAVNLILSKLAIPGKNVPLVQPSKGRQKGASKPPQPDESFSAAGSENLITVSMARHAAESAASMCSFAVAIVEYNDSFKPYKLAAEKLEQVQKELRDLEAQMDSNDSAKTQDSLSHHPKAEAPTLEDVSEEAELGEEGLQRLQEEVDELQESFDKAVIEKHSLAQTCQQLSEKLKSANHLLESLKGRQDSWKKKCDTLPEIEMLMANCILAAAITVYCGPLKTALRHKFFDSLQKVCQSQGFPAEDQDLGSVLKLEDYPEFMLGKSTLQKLVLEGLPSDSTSQQNAAIITYPHSRAWPLVLDSLGIAQQWLKAREAKAQVIKYQDSKLHNVLIKALEDGSTVLIDNVSTQELSEDSMLLDVLQCRQTLYRSKTVAKLSIGGKEVECNPSFRVYLVSPDPLSALPPEIASLVCTVVFHPEVSGLQESILDSFLQLQNQKTSQDRAELRVEIHSQSEQLEKVEQELLQVLSKQDSSQVEDPRVAKNILALNKAYEDADESLCKAVEGYSLMNEVHLSMLRGLASQAAVIVGTVCAMSTILPLYHTSYANILSIFLNFIEQAGSRIQGEDALAKMTRAAYCHFVKEYFEKDKLLFSFMLSEEIEISQGRATREEQEFVVSPSAGHRFAIRGLVTQSSLMTDVTPIAFGKKPFDWMSDSQWQMLLMMASRFAWMHPILERQGKDGKDAMWRTIGEGTAPETLNLAENLGYKLLPMQQLLILSAMRPERITQFMMSFSAAVLNHGQKQEKVMSPPTDLTRVVKSTRVDQLPVILYKEEPHLAIVKLQHCASKMKVPLTICYLHGNGDDEVESSIAALEAASSQGHWILLHNIQLTPKFVSRLPSLLEKLPAREKWKVWLSVHGECITMPSSLLSFANKVVLDPPESLLGGMLYCLSSLSKGVVSASARIEWLPAVHSMAMLHTTVGLRKRVYAHAWSMDCTWKHHHYMDAINYMKKDIADSELKPQGSVGPGVKPVSWTGIRYMINEVIYGGTITDPVSASTFVALTDHWIHTGGPKREIGRYHIPTAFFTPGTRLNALIQAVETAHPPLVLTTDLCGLYTSPMIKLGWKDDLFPKLSLLQSHLQEHLPLTTSPLQKLITMKRRESFDSSSILSMAKPVKSQQKNGVAVIVERLPSFIAILSQLTELNLSYVPSSLLHSLRAQPSLLKEIPIQANLERLLEKMPSVWKKEILFERLKKHGQDTPFGVFMKSETSRMSECLQTIISDLKDLQSALSSSSTGDVLLESPQLVDLALCLLTSAVPRSWLSLVGPSSPPGTWPLREWLQDLMLRYSFMDRVLNGGLLKTATYWLGAFFNPQAFLNIVQQTVIRLSCTRSGAVEQFAFHAELTNRDKDHIRDPPPDGELFIYGAYIWGCGYEKSTNTDFQDIPPKQVPVSLPVLHLSPSILHSQQPEQPPQGALVSVEAKGPHVLHCPCFSSNGVRTGERESVGDGNQGQVLFTVNLISNDSTATSKWPTRNLSCTLRPF